MLGQKHIYWDYKKKLHGEDKAETPLGALTTWELSIQQIGSTHVTQGVVEHLLTVAAFLSHVEISESLFREFAQRTRPVPVWLECFMSGGEWVSYRYGKMVSELLTRSLAQGRNDNAGVCYLSLHPMIKDWLQSGVADSDRTIYIVETINILANYIDTNLQERSLQEARGLLGHLDACISSHSRFRTAACRLGFGDLRKHGVTFSAFYMSHGRYREAEEGLQAVLEHDVQEYGQKHHHTFQTTRRLADAFVHGGKYHKAHDLLSQALHDSKENANLETLHILLALAGVLAKLDRPADAERCYKKALQGHALRKDQVEPHGIFLLYERLAEVKRCLGKHGEAESFYMKAHNGYQQECAYDEDATSDMLRAAGGIADLHRTLGRYAEAEISYQEAWQGYKMSLGPDHPKTTCMLTNLAITYRNQGRLVDAEKYAEEAVRMSQKSLGPEHPDSLRALMNLSICIDKQGRYKEAEIKSWEVLKGRQKKLGLNHVYTRRTLERLAHMLWVQGLHDKAETVIQKILTKAGRLPSDHRPKSDYGRFGALTALYTDAQKRDQSRLAAHHVDALETCECLRLIYLEQGEYDIAKKLAEQIHGAPSPEEPKQNQAERDEERVSLSPKFKEHDLEGFNYRKMVNDSLQLSVQQLRNALPTKDSILLLMLRLLVWTISFDWTDYSNRAGADNYLG